MGKSLQDQLLKAGLANKKQAVKARKAKNSREKLARTGHEIDDAAQQAVRAAEEQKRERDRELNQRKHEEAEQRAVDAQVAQLVQMNRITERGDTAFNFTFDAVIKTLLITAGQRRALVDGRVGIVVRGESLDLLPRAAVEKIAERRPGCVALLNSVVEEADEADDPYADFKVPDDLQW